MPATTEEVLTLAEFYHAMVPGAGVDLGRNTHLPGCNDEPFIHQLRVAAWVALLTFVAVVRDNEPVAASLRVEALGPGPSREDLFHNGVGAALETFDFEIHPLLAARVGWR